AHRRQPQRFRFAPRPRAWGGASDARDDPRACRARARVSEALDEHARPVPAEAPVAERVPAGEWRRTSPLGFVVQGIAALRGMALPFVAVLYGSREAWGAAPGLLLPI